MPGGEKREREGREERERVAGEVSKCLRFTFLLPAGG